MTFEEKIILLKIIIIGCFGVCGIILIYETFIASDNLMHVMLKAMETGTMSSADIISKIYLLPIIPGVVVLERMWKKISTIR